MEDNEIVILVIAVTGLLIILGIFILSFFLVYKRKQNIHEDKLNKLNQAILETQLEVQEQTLKTISQEIHDNIGQVLSLAKLNLNRMDISRPNELQDKISDSKNLVSKAIQDLRDLSKSLNTDNIREIGLVKAIAYELDMMRKSGFTTHLNVEGSPEKLENQKELILFRIIQEVFNNVIKHSEASDIKIMVQYNSELTISIADNGRGFNLTPLNENDKSDYGLGIRNMYSRATLIGADFKMSSTIGIGTVVFINVPLHSNLS